MNNKRVDALSEVVEKMFYCEKDEGGASIKGGKKVQSICCQPLTWFSE
jgi:hypothetical protein